MVHRATILAGVVLFSMNCGIGQTDSATGDNSGSQSQSLTDYGPTLPDGGYNLWPRVGYTYPIHICFRQSSVGSPTGSWATDTSVVANALTATWEASSGIDFQFEGDCGASVPGDWVPIELVFHSAEPNIFGGYGAPYKGGRLGGCNCQVTLNYGANKYEFETTAVHEVGHSLGFEHERSRMDFTGCLNLATGAFVAPEPNPASRAISSAPDLMSIMSNWECYDTRIHDSYSFYWLSWGDANGVSMAYPRYLTRFRRSIAGRYGWQLSDRLLVRRDGAIRTDWTEMKADPSVFSAVPNWFIYQFYQYVPLGQGIEFPVGTQINYNQIMFTFTDRWGRSNTGIDVVEANSSRHTAVLNSTLLINQL